MNQQNPSPRVTTGLSGGWVESGNLVGSVLAGWLLGFLVDTWLNTDPWFVIIGILLGSYSGFMRMWHYSKKMEEDPREH